MGGPYPITNPKRLAVKIRQSEERLSYWTRRAREGRLYYGTDTAERIARCEREIAYYEARLIQFSKRKALPKPVRRFIIARDGLICRLCGGPVEESDVHIDHIHPRSLGGRDDDINLQVTHSTCNVRKGARLLT